MPNQKHPFERGGPTRIEISWGMAWRDFTVRFDGNIIATVNGGMAALKKGTQFTLADGSELGIRLVMGSFGGLPDLQVTRNGQLLPGTGADPEIKLRSAYQILYFLGGLNILLGVVAELGQVAFLQDLGVGWFSVMFGAVYLLLGYFAQQKVKLAIGIAVILLVVDAVLGLVLSMSLSSSPPLGGLFIRGAFVFLIARGWTAIDEMNA